MHWGTFPILTGIPEEFGKHLQRGAMQKLAPGKHLEI
jgi:L-ascorbate metabolism protein UlaG (beta-lactamase superfamily)